MLPRFTTSSSIRQRCKSLIRDNHCCRLRLIGLELLRTVRPVSKRFCVYHCFQISQSVTRLITTTGRLSLPRTLSSSITCLSSTFDLHCIYHELWSRAFAVGANLTNCENMEVVGSCSLSSSSTEIDGIPGDHLRCHRRCGNSPKLPCAIILGPTITS